MKIKNVIESVMRIKVMQRGQERLKRLLSIALYRTLGLIHLALITDAGLLIAVLVPSLFCVQIKLEPISYALALGYVVGDLVRLPVLRGTVISMGFPLIFLILLADSPFAVLLIAILGSLVSETLQSKFISKQRLPWYPALRRAFFYTGHHAVAGLGALIVYQLVRGSPPWLQLEVIHIQAALAYVVVYSLVSMLLVWPHDWRIRLFLVPDEEPVVRIHFLATLLLLPIPASLFYLYNLDLDPTAKVLVVVGALPPIFVLLFFLARHFARTEEERDRLALREQISQRLGSPANMSEMVQLLLTTMEDLVEYRWGAVYSLIDGELGLYGEKLHQGPVLVQYPDKAQKVSAVNRDAKANEKQMVWPAAVKLDEGILANLKEDLRPQFFDDGLTPATASDPYLPRKTALAVFPIMVESQQEGEVGSPKLLGLIALARPRRLFTIWDWEKGQALSSQAGSVLLSVQRLEKTLRELSQQVDDYARERVHQAMQELAGQQVDVSKILAVVSERAFQENLLAVLRGIVEGKRGNKISLAPMMLTEIYNQVRDETPGMPPLDAYILQLLQTVTSSLSLAFSFRYQFPDVGRGPAFKKYYQLLLDALNANTVSRIVALDSKIGSIVELVRNHGGVHRETWRTETAEQPMHLPPEAIEEVERLRGVIHPLKKYGEAGDFTDQKTALGQALERLVEHERAVQKRLQNPERLVTLQVLSGWRSAVTNALEDLARGPARLKVGLRSNQALSLEEITVGLVLHNQGPGVASGVVVQLEPSPDYEVLEGKIDWGTLTTGKTIEPEFTLRSEGTGPLRLQFRITYHDPERRGKVEEFADLLYLREPPPCFTEIPNPYTPGLPLKPGNPTFVGREDIFDFIQRSIPALTQKTVLILVGERRTGKTSILKQLPARLNASHCISVYIDGQALGIDPGMGSFFLSIAIAIADGLEEAGIVIPRLTLEELGESPQHVFTRRFLPMVREQIGERILLLTVDEFEELGSRVGRGRLAPEIFPYLRHLIQHEEQLTFIFSGTHRIEELIGDYWSVLFNIAKYKKVGFLEREETIRLITEKVQLCGMVYDDLAVDEVLRVTACHPYLTQLLCSILVDRCNETRCSYVTVQNVRDAVDELLETGRAHLVFLWQTSDWREKLALAALAELRDRLDQVTAAAIIDRLKSYQIDLTPGQIMQKMEQLVGREIVREIPGGTVSYDYTAQLYAHWLRRYKSLSKVIEEVSDEFVTE